MRVIFLFIYESLLTGYVNLLRNNNINDYIVNTIVRFNEMMVRAIKNYYLGYQALAYKNFTDAMKLRGIRLQIELPV